MTTMFDVDPSDLIKKAAEELKNVPDLKAPAWSSFVKTGAHKERPPVSKDWWYMRAAAVLRKVALFGPLGAEKLRGHFGGRKNRGARPEKTYKGSGAIARRILQSLEKAGFIKKVEKTASRKGRILTPKGRSFLDKAATTLAKGLKNG